MKRTLSAVLLMLMTAMPAFALSQSSVPPKFPIVWGSSAGSAYIRSIPVPSQIGTQNCAASLTDGFPPLTFVPSVAGGCPPFGADFNGILKQVTQWNQWQQASGPIFYDSGFAAAIGGYPSGSMLNSAVTPGTIWMSTADNNTTNPDAGGANWVQAPGQIPIGTPVQSLTSTVPYGYVSANGKTIGNAASNATDRANADTQFLFAFVWANCPSATCPIYTNSGSASTRGASAAADYAANKAIAVNNMNGAALMGADSQGGSSSNNLASVPVTSGNATTPASILGENLHALTVAELAAHTHSITDPGHTHSITDPGHSHGGVIIGAGGVGIQSGSGYTSDQGSTASSHTGITINSAMTGITATNSTGNGTGHNTVPRSVIVYWNLKL